MHWKPIAILVDAALLSAGGYYAWLELKPDELPPGFAMSNGRIEAERVDVATKLAGRIKEVELSALDAWRMHLPFSKGTQAQSFRQA